MGDMIYNGVLTMTKDKLTKLKREVLARLQGKEIYLVNGRYKIGGIRNEKI